MDMVFLGLSIAACCAAIINIWMSIKAYRYSRRLDVWWEAMKVFAGSMDQPSKKVHISMEVYEAQLKAAREGRQ